MEKIMNLLKYYNPNVKQLTNHESAFEYFQWILKQYDFTVSHVNYQSKGRHKIYHCIKDEKEISIYVKYDKEWFHSFNHQFPEFIKQHPEYSGFGESINVEYLSFAVNNNIDFVVFVNKEGEIYQIQAKELHEFCKKYKLYRSQNRTFNYKLTNFTGEREEQIEQTYSFPLNILTNWINVWKQNSRKEEFL